jgi:PAS domain S-box-containing protein
MIPATSWVTVAWSMAAALCVSLSLAHLLIGARQKARSSLFFAAASLAAAAIAALELAGMRAQTPDAWGSAIRWMHLPIFVLVASLVLFVRSYFRAGRPWLAASVIAVRGAALLVNFIHRPNLNFEEISGLRAIRFFGETVVIAEGIGSRWTRLGELGSILFLAFLMDATRTVWRRGERRASALGLTMILFVLAAAGHTALVHAGVSTLPYLIAFPYLGIVLVMGYELSADVVRASELARSLRRSEDALRESDRRLALAAEATGLGFWSWDLDGGKLWISGTGRSIRGLAPDERLEPARFLDLIHPEDRAPLLEKVNAAVESGGRFDLEYRIVRPDGGVRWVALRGSGWRERGDRRPRAMGAFIDVTARRSAEEDARRRDAELAHLSRVHMLGEVSLSLAHELSQPLTSILCSAQAGQQLIAMSPSAVSGEMSEILDDIVQEDRHATDVIRRLRELLKKGPIASEPLVAGDLVADVVRLARAELARRGTSVATELDPELPLVRGDRVQIAQVLLNLVTNACDAMADTKPEHRRLRIRAGRNGDGTVEFAVSDRGTGVPPEQLERIFEPFVTTKAQGLGLGLAVCRTIVAGHRGRLWAVNNPEGGATLFFTLPVFEGAEG